MKTMKYKNFDKLYSEINKSFEITRIGEGVLIATAKPLPFCCPDYKNLELMIEKNNGWKLTAEDFFFANRLYFYSSEGSPSEGVGINYDVVNKGFIKVEERFIGYSREFMRVHERIKEDVIKNAKKNCQIIIGKCAVGIKKPLPMKETEIIKNWDLGELVKVYLGKQTVK